MYTNCLMADAMLDTFSFDTAEAKSSVVEDGFATTPMLPTVPAYGLLNEEELHTSFEQAISDRVVAVSKQLSLKSGPLVESSVARRRVTTEPLHYAASGRSCHGMTTSMAQYNITAAPFSRVRNMMWQRYLIFVSLALMFMLIGFDLMGLLILHAH